MSKYTLIGDEGGVKVTIEGEAEGFDDILELFKQLLLGMTFSADLVDRLYLEPEEYYNGN